MIVTINTDASFNPTLKIGAYAYWIVYNGIRIKKAGVLKDCDNSLEAEIKAVANALYKLTTLTWSDVFYIVVNVDCIPAINLITGKGQSKIPGTIQAVEAIARYTQELRIKNHSHKRDSEYINYRHVKAHNGKPDKRSYVNDWCDKAAKFQIKKYIQTIN